MKKILFVVLVAILLLSMTTTVFASSATLNGTTTSTNMDVQAIYRSDPSDANISVDISWSGLNFTYNSATQVWDADSHKYVDGTLDGWAASNAAITITNHSNVILQAGLRFDSKDGFDNIGMIFTADAPYIGSAYTGEDAGTACTVTIPLIPDGPLAASATERTSIGTITVSVQPVVNKTPKEIAMELSNSYLTLNEQNAAIRGAVYFKDQAVKDAFTNALRTMNELELTDEPALNTALNNVITAFYNGLTIKQ